MDSTTQQPMLPYPVTGFTPFVEAPQLRVTWGHLCCSPSVINDPRVVAALGYAVPIMWPPPRIQ